MLDYTHQRQINRRLRMLATQSLCRSLVARRGFQGSAQLLKKHSGNKKNAKEVEEEFDVIDLTQYSKQAQKEFTNTLDLHKKKLNETKQGVADPRMLDDIKMQDGTPLKTIASTSMKGKNALLVTVYDPKDTKHVVSSILAANLNLTPVKVPNNEQQLKIALPPPTTESRLKLCKSLKAVFEEYKNSSSRHSLGHIRGEILKDMKSLSKKDDKVRKVIQDVEKIHKEYVSKLEEQLKQAEKNVMN